MNVRSNQIVSEKDIEILEAVRAIKFGTVLVVIHNAEIVQIESTNKRRFDKTKDSVIS
ncbi:MAG: YezD family protein [Candidatus Omnitrophica bacterium]|nr:YezD family protein [Candidatus Omnitrophota bacterium]